MRYAFIAFLLGLSSLVKGQILEDQRTILQMCIDLDELQGYFHANEVEGRKPLIIHDGGLVPTTLTLKKFGEPVLFMTTTELFFHDKHAYLDFEKFEVSTNNADIEFRYLIEGVTVSLKLKKTDGSWVVKAASFSEK